jgi:DNA-binding transcriptional ArsR family regulator
MADLLPSRPDIPDDDKEPRVVGLDSDEADDLLAAISSETAREALSTLHDEPAPASDVADRIDTSIQNAQYHLDRLETAGLIEAAGTAYSEKGREMTVYAPASRPLVIVAAPDGITAGAADDGGEAAEAPEEAVTAEPSDDDIAAPTAD